MKNIKEIVSQIVEMYGTRSPFAICKKMQISVLFVDLPDNINGFFVNSSKNGAKSIMINKSVPEQNVKKVCAHELAHAILHSEINATTFDKNSEFQLDKFEMEADFFSNLLLL